MGPMMGGGMLWFLIVVVLVLLLVLGLIALGVLGVGGALGRRRPSSPEDILRERYARGEIGHQAYQDALGDVLKDRYMRGELTSEEYEGRVAVLLGRPGERPAESGERGDLPPPS